MHHLRVVGAALCAALCAAVVAAAPDGPGWLASSTLPATSLDAADGPTTFSVAFRRDADRAHSAAMRNVTLVTHGSTDRANALWKLCRAWRGPVVLVLYQRPEQQRQPDGDDGSDDGPLTAEATAGLLLDPPLSRVAPEDRKAAADGAACLCKHANVHVVVVSSSPTAAPASSSRPATRSRRLPTPYPFNFILNLGHASVVGRRMLLLDADSRLFPRDRSKERVVTRAYDAAVAHVARADGVSEATVAARSVFVVPSVETVSPALPLPATLTELRRALRVQEACPFYGHYCRHCQGPTNLDRYVADALRHDAAPPSVSSPPPPPPPPPAFDVTGAYQDGYEPYVVADRAALPLPLEGGFVGRGYSRSALFYALHVLPAGVSLPEAAPADTTPPHHDDGHESRCDDDSAAARLPSSLARRRVFTLTTGPYLVHKGRGDDPLKAEATAAARLKAAAGKWEQRWNQERYAVLQARVAATAAAAAAALEKPAVSAGCGAGGPAGASGGACRTDDDAAAGVPSTQAVPAFVRREFAVVPAAATAGRHPADDSATPDACVVNRLLTEDAAAPLLPPGFDTAAHLQALLRRLCDPGDDGGGNYGPEPPLRVVGGPRSGQVASLKQDVAKAEEMKGSGSGKGAGSGTLQPGGM